MSMKRMLAFALALALIFSLGAPAYAAELPEEEGAAQAERIADTTEGAPAEGLENEPPSKLSEEGAEEAEDKLEAEAWAMIEAKAREAISIRKPDAELQGRNDKAIVYYSDGDGFESYASLAAAIAAVGTHGESEEEDVFLGPLVQLSKDVNEDVVIPEGKNVELNLNGHTLTVPGAEGLQAAGGTLTVSNGTLNSAADDFVSAKGGSIVLGANLTVMGSSSVLYAYDGGVITLAGANVSSNNTKYAAAYVTDANSAIVVESGSLSQTGANVVTLSVANGATAEIKGGTVGNDASTVIAAKTGGLVTVSGGEVSTTADMVAGYAISGGKIVVTGGTVSSANWCALSAIRFGQTASGSVEVNGGVVTKAVGAYEGEDSYVKVTGGVVGDADGWGVYVADGALAEISGGVIKGYVGVGAESKGKIGITGGEFTRKPDEAYLANNKMCSDDVNENGYYYLLDAVYVTFDPNNGDEPFTVKLVKGATVDEPEAPVREGFTFSAWSLNGKAFDFETPVEDNLTLVAKWGNQLIFMNGEEVYRTELIEEGKNGSIYYVYASDRLEGYTDENGVVHTFVGWASKPDASFAEVEYPWNGVDGNGNRTVAQTTARTVPMNGSDVTLYGIFEVKHTLTIDLNGGSGNVATSYSSNGNVVSFSHSTYKNTRSGYTLLGFSTDRDAVEPEIPYLSSGYYWMHLDADTTLYAVWQTTPYTITFKANGGEGDVPEAIIYTAGDGSVTLPGQGSLSKEGREFLGWYFGSSISDLSAGKSLTSTQLKNFYEAGAEYPVSTGNKTALAVWRNVGVKVSYDLNGAVTSAGVAMTKKDALYDYGKASVNLGTNGANYEGKAKGFTYPNNNNYTGLTAWYDAARDTFYASNKAWYKLDASNTAAEADGSYSLALTAVWGYTPVTYHLGGESVARDFVARAQTGNTAANWVLSTTPAIARSGEGLSREGYVFDGWALEEGGAAVYQPGDEIAVVSGIELYPAWAETVTVSFDVKGGSPVEAVTLKKGDTLAKPEDPTKEGLDFGGWFDADGKAFSFETPVEQSMTLAAKWLATLSFDPNGGVASAQRTPITVEEGSEAKFFNTLYQPSMEGKQFLGYSLDPAFDPTDSDPEYAAFTLDAYQKSVVQKQYAVTLNRHTTLYAVYGNNYKVTLDKNCDDSGVNIPAGYSSKTGTWVQIIRTNISRSGYNFLGYAYDPSAAQPDIPVGSGNTGYLYLRLKSDVTLYAVWTPITYTVRFDANGGEGALPEDIVYTLDTKADIVLPTGEGLSKEGKVLVGWSFTKRSDLGVSGTLNKADYLPGATIPASAYSGNKTVYAVWKAMAVTVNYDLNGHMTTAGKLSQNKTKTYGYGVATTLETQAATYEGKVKGFTYPNGNNYTGNAGWYDAAHDAYYRAGSTRYTLDKTNTNLNEDGSYSLDLVILWTYTPVTFYNEDGSLKDRLFVHRYSTDKTIKTFYTTDTEPVIAIEGAEKPGCEFLGWAEEAGGEPVYKAGDAITALSSLELYPVYQSEQFTLSFRDGENVLEELSVTAGYGAAVAIPADPEKPGFLFRGWATEPGGEVVYTFGMSITLEADTTLYAVYEKIPGAEIKGRSVRLEDRIELVFGVTFPEGSVFDYAALVSHGETYITKKADAETKIVDGELLTLFSCPVYPNDLKEKVTIRAYDQDGRQLPLLVNGETVEVYAYAVSDYLSLDSTDPALKNLIDALVVYGDYVGYYASHRDDNTSMNGVPVERPTKDALLPYKGTVEGAVSGVSARGGTLYFDSATVARVYFSGDVQGATVTVNGKSASLRQDGSSYYVEISGIAANKLDVKNEVALSKNGQTVKVFYSGYSYLYSVICGNNSANYSATLKDALSAMYKYCEAAKAYFG